MPQPMAQRRWDQHACRHSGVLATGEHVTGHADDEHVGMLTRMLTGMLTRMRMNIWMTSRPVSKPTSMLVCLLMMSTLMGIMMMSVLTHIHVCMRAIVCMCVVVRTRGRVRVRARMCACACVCLLCVSVCLHMVVVAWCTRQHGAVATLCSVMLRCTTLRYVYAYVHMYDYVAAAAAAAAHDCDGDWSAGRSPIYARRLAVVGGPSGELSIDYY